MNWTDFLSKEEPALLSLEATIQEALDRMLKTRHKTGIFLDVDRKVVGIITERDVIRAFILGVSKTASAFERATRSVTTIHSVRSVEYALGIIISKNIKRAPIVDEDGRYVGLLTQDSFLSYFESANDGAKQKAINLVQGRALITAKSSDSLSFVASLMYKNKIGLLPLTKNDVVVGIISESDILKLIYSGASFENAAGEYMNKNVLFVEEDAYSDEALRLMDETGVSHVLVLGKNSEAIGALSKRDIVRNLKDSYQKILEKKLKNARDALSRLPNPIIELCRSGEFFYVSWNNEKAEEAMDGYLFDMKITDIIRSDDFSEALYECAESGENRSCILYINGRTYDVMCHRLEESSVQLIFNDLTEIKKREEYLRLVINFLPEMIAVTTSSSLISCNKSLLDFFGVEDMDAFALKHKSLPDTFIQENGYLYKNKDWLAIAAKNFEDGAETLVKISDEKKGEVLIFSLNATPFMKERGEFLITLFDVTESKKQKEALEEKNKELEELASIDSLTRIFNRTKFRDIAQKEFRRYKKDGLNLSLAIFDIDHFKKINDTHGHNVGDYALKTVASLVSSKLCEQEIFARWGGEEFVILCFGMEVSATVNLCETLRASISGYPFDEVGKITCSFGVAGVDSAYDLDSLIENADKALYVAKRGGRNKTEQYLA